MSSDVAARLTRAAFISLVRFWTKRSPTRIAGTSIAAITSINSRVRRLIGASFRAQFSEFRYYTVTFRTARKAAEYSCWNIPKGGLSPLANVGLPLWSLRKQSIRLSAHNLAPLADAEQFCTLVFRYFFES